MYFIGKNGEHRSEGGLVHGGEGNPGDDQWDGNVAARLLYRLANLAAKSNGLPPVVA